MFKWVTLFGAGMLTIYLIVDTQSPHVPSENSQFPGLVKPPAILEAEPYSAGVESPDMKYTGAAPGSEPLSTENQSLEPDSQSLEHQPEDKTPSPDPITRRYPQRDHRQPDRLTYQ